jgi:MFS family permease
MSGRVDIYGLSIITGSGIVIFVLARLRARRLARDGYERLSSLARDEVAFGGVVVSLAFIHLRGAVSYAGWMYLAGGLLLGILLGRLASNRLVRKWKVELETEGRLLPMRKGKRPWVEQSLMIAFALGMAVAIALLPQPQFSANWLLVVGPLACGGMGGFFVGSGLSIWLWAKRKVRQGFGKMTIPWT